MNHFLAQKRAEFEKAKRRIIRIVPAPVTIENKEPQNNIVEKVSPQKQNKEVIIGTCPHCSESFFVERKDLNCRIFRHGYYKSNWTPLDPHLSKTDCLFLKEKNLINGCGGPMEYIESLSKFVKCDYK